MEKLLDKFLRYVKVETTSIEEEEVKQPSNDKEWDLLRMLEKELKGLGVNTRLSEFGYLYAVIPSNSKKKIPSLAFIAHVDTSPDVSGANVKPQIVKDYNGEDIVLNKDITISVTDNPILAKLKGKTLITTDGTTLLGADDKAGVSEIMCLVEYLVNTDIEHGDICIAFTPDEEIGRGTDNFDIVNFGADFGYTIDGGSLGELEFENFNAASLMVEVFGKTIHPGDAKDKMVNAIRILNEYDNILPSQMKPEYTSGYEGFYHLHTMSGSVENAKAEYLIREHDKTLFENKKQLALDIGKLLNKKYGDGTVKVTIKDSYYNMAEIIKEHYHLIDNAVVAMERVGVTPIIKPIRGGTDGARLSFMNLPCANICTGGQNYHSKREFACLEDMEKVVKILIEIVKIYANL